MRCSRIHSPINLPVSIWGALAIALTMVIPARSSFAQASASAEVNGVASDENRHPVTYLWLDEVEFDDDEIPTTDPSHYYTFYYTGTVLADGTVPLGTPISRIPIPFEEWELNKSEIILSLASFYDEVYQTGTDPEERKSLVNRNVKLDKNFEYVDTTDPESKKKKSKVDPLVAAEWAYYYDQMALWSFYCKRTVLHDPFATQGLSSLSDIERRENIKKIEEYTSRDDVDSDAIDPEGLLRKIERQRLLDQGFSASAIDSADEGAGLGESSVYDPWADWYDPERSETFREDFQFLADEREQYARDIMNVMLGNITGREVERERYDKWKTQGRENLKDFVEAWTKVRSGDRVTFDNVFYLISEEPIESVPPGSANILKRKQLTPQDLIDENGRLKAAEFDQGI